MGVYIKGKRKPGTCYDCDFVDGSDDCFFGLGYTGDMCDCVYEDCPLIEVKTPHGDLIERAELQSRVLEEYRAWGDDYDALQILGDIEDAPTVIEAEVE